MKNILPFLFTLISFITKAQNPGDVAQNYGTYPGFNNIVYAVALQNDGKILVGGAFTTYQQKTENYIIRLNADGSKDTSFNTGIGFNGTVFTIAIQNDGKILLGGEFTTYKGINENKIIRLNTNGSKDTSFNTGTGFDYNVNSIVIQNDGKILLGGEFTTYKGINENKIVRLNTNGSKDTSFNIGTGFNYVVTSLAIQSNGKIIVGGDFTNYQGVTENRIIRLNTNGSKDTSFLTGIGFDYIVNSIAIQSDGKIIVGGRFYKYQGATENRIIRLNEDGFKDTSFNTGTGFNDGVKSIAIQNDGKIILGGEFITYQGVPEYRIIRLNTDGSKDTSFITGFGFSNIVTTLAIHSDGKILSGGHFYSYKGGAEKHIIRLNTDGSKDTSLVTGTGFNDSVRSIAEQNDGKILVGGSFSTYKGVTENSIIRLNTDGSKDTSFITGAGFTNSVHSIAIQNDGKILVGGNFSLYQGVVQNYIIRLNEDGSKDTSFNTGNGFNATVTSIVLQNDGKILVGGSFSTYKGVTENRIIRLNADGSKDTSFNTGTGFNSHITSITVQNDGKILVGGYFTTYQGVTENRIIRLNADGSKDISFSTGVGFDNIVTSIKLQNDGKIIVGGNFISYKGFFEYRIIRLNTDGSKDTSFTSGTGFNDFVYSIVIQSNGKILIGGSFTSYQGGSENKIICLNTDGSKDTNFNTGTGFDYYVNSIVIQNDGKILLGGAFYTYQGSNESVSLIKLHTGIVLDIESYNNKNSFNVYPNPVKDILNIQSLENQSILSINIFDLQGKLILKDSKERINVNQLSKGLYIIKIQTEEGELTKKFIKE